jgi:hypothetical protein
MKKIFITLSIISSIHFSFGQSKLIDSTQKLIQLNEVNKSEILLYNASETMFKIHDECNWDDTCIKEKLNNPNILKNIPFIKLRSTDRDLIK